MPSSDTIKAQQAATAAEVAAATAKLYSQSQQDLADDAAASATEASGYANNASNSASLAQQYYSMSIEGVLWFVGDFSSPPTNRSNGSALEPGDMYKNTTDNLVYSYNSDGTWSTMNSDATTIQDLYAAGESLLTEGLELYDASMDAYDVTTTLISNVGQVIPDTVEIFNVSENYQSFRSRGFYSAGDGGAATWIATGNTDSSKAGTHLVTEGKVYNANGYEYLLDISSGDISVLQNGAVAYPYSQCVDMTTDDFVCLGQVVNGIFNQLPIPVYTNSGSSIQGKASIRLRVPTNYYRIGKEPIKLFNFTDYDFQQSNIFVYAGASYTFEKLGYRLNGLEHGYDEIKEKYEAVSETKNWDAVSLRKVGIRGGYFWGDQDMTKTASECSSGVGVMILNPGDVNMYGTSFENFHWCGCVMPAMVAASDFAASGWFDVNGTTDYVYICEFLGSQFGNFYNFNTYDCNFYSGRRGVLRVHADVASLIGGTVTNNIAWRDTTKNVDGTVPAFNLVTTGTAFKSTASYVSNAGGLSETRNPSVATVYTSAKAHVFDAIYTEWTYMNFMISKVYYSQSAGMRSISLVLNGISQYKNDFTNYKGIIEFEEGCFGEFDDDGKYTWPANYTGVTLSPQGIHQITVGAPTRDYGVGLHGGWDFKYGPYNANVASGSDVDFLRYSDNTAKEMFNPYGMIAGASTVILPTRSLQHGSHVCLWIKDLTGNFDPSKFELFRSGNNETDNLTDPNAIMGQGENQIDFGNGYKLITILNKGWWAYDGQGTWSPNVGIRLNGNTASTPIIIKAVEAYTGGFPVFPGGCDYIPQSGLDTVFSTNAYYGFINGCGGGLFQQGDIVNPWIGVARSGSDYSPTVSSNYQAQSSLITSGCPLSSAYQVSFTATIVSVDSTNSETTISIPSADIPYICLGIPLYVSSGSSTSVTGNQKLKRRVINSDGTLANEYVVSGVIGAADDSLAINQANASSQYQIYGEMKANTLTMGYNNSTTGSRQINFYPNGSSNVRSGYIEAAYTQSVASVNNGGVLNVTFGNVNLLAQLNTRNTFPLATDASVVGSESLRYLEGHFKTLYSGGLNVVSVGATVPTSSTSSGVKGQIASDSTYIYLCTATNTWIRTPITSW